jgi:antitoxin (DNA-binding transcriptional repressor) of toxin-antitoxin stability system
LDSRASPRPTVRGLTVGLVLLRLAGLFRTSTLNNTLNSLEFRAARAYGRGMEQTISTVSIRRQPDACLARVSRGDKFLVLRRGHPTAVLRPSRDREAFRSGTATLPWRNLCDLMAARREPVLITWCGDGMAVLEPLPPGSDWEDES